MTSAVKSGATTPTIEVVGQRQVLTIAGAVLVAMLVARPGVLAGQQPADSKREDVVVTKPSPEQLAAHRSALQGRHAMVEAALVKARAEGEAARRALLEKQRAAQGAENAEVMAEIARRRASSQSPELQDE